MGFWLAEFLSSKVANSAAVVSHILTATLIQLRIATDNCDEIKLCNFNSIFLRKSRILIIPHDSAWQINILHFT